MIYVSQGTLRNLRNEMFERMETLPVKYFDTHAHGDIMSIYTNDIDTLRQMISQSIPQLISCVDHDSQCAGQYAYPEYTLTLVTLFMVGVMLVASKNLQAQWKIFYGAAEEPWYCKRLYRGDDGRPEGG